MDKIGYFSKQPKDILEGFRRRLVLFSLLWGPGLIVMLADTDAGSLITAAQSGAQWGYHMVLPQIVLMPILYFIQEITVRLGIVTSEGHGALIRTYFGRGWAYLSGSTLLLSAIGALITEFSGVAGVGALLGIPPWISVSAAAGVLILIGLSGSYARVERIGILFGLLELVYLGLALGVHPYPHHAMVALLNLPWTNSGYLMLLAANVGAVIMPWMIFYQQGAVIDKGLHHYPASSLRHARKDTAVGAVITQTVMLAMVVLVAATVGQTHPNAPLNTVQQIAQALIPFLGGTLGRLVFGLGMIGASMVAALVVSVAGAWGMGEVFGFSHSLNDSVRQSPLFYSLYTAAHVIGVFLVLFSRNLVTLTVDVEIMNAMLLPLVLGFLLVLEARVLPPQWRMHGVYRYLVWSLSALVIGFGLFTIVTSI